MHALALQLSPVLAAEKSKTPFYIAGALLVAWALVLSLVLGVRKADFPSSLRGQWVVSGISIALVLAAVATAVLTAGSPSKSIAATSTVAPYNSTSTPSTPTSTSGAPVPATPGAHTKLALAADPAGTLAYNTKALSAHSGSITIVMTNMSPLEHNVTVAQGSTVLGATPTFAGGTKTLSLSLKPGTYTFYCSVPGHRQAGMEGTLTIL